MMKSSPDFPLLVIYLREVIFEKTQRTGITSSVLDFIYSHLDEESAKYAHNFLSYVPCSDALRGRLRKYSKQDPPLLTENRIRGWGGKFSYVFTLTEKGRARAQELLERLPSHIRIQLEELLRDYYFEKIPKRLHP